jgi:hypothetical protein
MTAPLSAVTQLSRQRRGSFDAAPDGHRGRWPATDELIGPATLQAPTDRAESGPSATAAARQLADAAGSPVNIEVNVAADDQQAPAPERPATFAERMATISAHFTNPSTGETSVDGPLVTVDARELDYEADAPSHRQRQSASRLR